MSFKDGARHGWRRYVWINDWLSKYFPLAAFFSSLVAGATMLILVISGASLALTADIERPQQSAVWLLEDTANVNEYMSALRKIQEECFESTSRGPCFEETPPRSSDAVTSMWEVTSREALSACVTHELPEDAPYGHDYIMCEGQASANSWLIISWWGMFLVGGVLLGACFVVATNNRAVLPIHAKRYWLTPWVIGTVSAGLLPLAGSIWLFWYRYPESAPWLGRPDDAAVWFVAFVWATSALAVADLRTVRWERRYLGALMVGAVGLLVAVFLGFTILGLLTDRLGLLASIIGGVLAFLCVVMILLKIGLSPKFRLPFNALCAFIVRLVKLNLLVVFAVTILTLEAIDLLPRSPISTGAAWGLLILHIPYTKVMEPNLSDLVFGQESQ